MRTSLVLSVIAALVSTGAAFAQVPSERSASERSASERSAGSRTVGWRWERPTPQGSTVRGACRTSDALWVAGEVATFGRVSNDLRRFEGETLRTRSDFARIACCPSGVFAVGTEGALVHRSADGSVREQTLGDPRRLPMLTDVACVGERGVVVASGAGEAFVSEDGGRTFEARSAPQPLYSLHVIDGADGASRSAGSAADVASRSAGSAADVASRSASSTDDVLLAGGPRGAVARSTDLGRTWTVTRSGVRGNVLAFATRHADARGRVVVGDRGFIARGGLTGELRPVRSPVVTALHAIAGNTAGVMLAVGAEGVILRSTDRGARWSRVPFERTTNAEGLRVPSTFQAVWLDDAGHALAVGQQGVRARSDDGGRTWTDLSTARDHQRSGIAWHDGALIVVGTGSRIERSDDFGVTWRDEAPPAPGLDLRTPVVTPSGALVVTARPGVVARRDPSGRWTTTSLRPEAFFAGLARIGGQSASQSSGQATGSPSGGELLLVASDGTTYVSRDDGARWVEERRLTREVITGLFAGESAAWATGYWGMLMVREGR